MKIEDLKIEIDRILHPEPIDGDNHVRFPPHERLSSVHLLDTSYFGDPYSRITDRNFERILNDTSDPLQDTIQSSTVPYSLFYAALNLLGDSIIEYHEHERDWDLFRFYPPILMTTWAAFEAWVRIYSEILIAVVPSLPSTIRNTLLEIRPSVKKNGELFDRHERMPVMNRFWLLLKYGCNLEFDRGCTIWQKGELAAKVRNSLVHYDVSLVPSIKASELWGHIESILLLLIAPSTLAQRTLFYNQYDLHYLLVELKPFLTEFEEKPLHKDWPRGSSIIQCPFDHVDEIKYPSRSHRRIEPSDK